MMLSTAIANKLYILPCIFQDIIRQDDSDLTTILEVELNNQFLRDGLKIIIPPDIPTQPISQNHLQLKSIHSELYQKRASILKSFNCVYLYALDKTGKNIFSDNVCGNLAVSKSDEDFWSSFSLYTGVKDSESDKVTSDSGGGRVWSGGLGGEPAVFTPEVSFFLLICYRYTNRLNKPNSVIFFCPYNNYTESIGYLLCSTTSCRVYSIFLLLI